jgi:hypothetical protein
VVGLGLLQGDLRPGDGVALATKDDLLGGLDQVVGLVHLLELAKLFASVVQHVGLGLQGAGRLLLGKRAVHLREAVEVVHHPLPAALGLGQQVGRGDLQAA